MGKVKVSLNRNGIKKLMRSPQMLKICNEKAWEIAKRCGKGYSANKYTGKTRVNSKVFTSSLAAQKDNLDNNTLLKAIGGGGSASD